jgi:peptide deformylase
MIDIMIDDMHTSEGLGLAANQIGEESCIFVHNNFDGTPGTPAVMINPRVVRISRTTVIDSESCLSVPLFAADVPRSESIVIRSLDRNGGPVITRAEGMLARVIQHELDHLNGIIILDYVSKLRQNMYKRRLNKILRRRK